MMLGTPPPCGFCNQDHHFDTPAEAVADFRHEGPCAAGRAMADQIGKLALALPVPWNGPMPSAPEGGGR